MFIEHILTLLLLNFINSSLRKISLSNIDKLAKLGWSIKKGASLMKTLVNDLMCLFIFKINIYK